MKYGCIRDRHDVRDRIYKRGAPLTFPPIVDMREGFPEVYDQKNLGSCVANAVGGDCEFEEVQTMPVAVRPSRLFIYYNARLIDGTVNQDAGTEIRTGIKAVFKFGYPDESVWPYKIKSFKTKPTKAVYTAAAAHKITDKQYQRVLQTLDDIKDCLVAGNAVVFGFDVYESFESDRVAKTGVVPMPKKNEKMLGGHAVVIVGYNDDKNIFIVRNSWGNSWGDNGYCYFPYAFILSKACSDFWTITGIN